MAVPSTSSKRSAKLSNSATATSGTTSNRRKSGTNANTKLQGNFNLANQYLTQTASGQGLPSQTNISNAQNEILQLIKKREKMNNSAMA
jgi:hypothetical protein